MVMVWAHADGGEARLEHLNFLRELEDPSEFRYIASVPFKDFQMHLMEPSQNSADWYHFRTVHQLLGQAPDTPLPKIMYTEHAIKCRYGTQQKTQGRDAAGLTDVPLMENELLIHETISSLRLFGVIPLPSFVCSLMNTRVFMASPTLILFMVDNWFLGKFRGVFTLTQTGPFHQRAQVTAFASRRWPWLWARFLLTLVMRTVNQDRQVWEHKVHIAPRNLVLGDGPFTPYGTWLEQFFSKSSTTWEDVLADEHNGMPTVPVHGAHT